MAAEHEAEQVAGVGEWAVGQCACGRIVLRLGDLARSFTPEEFAELARLIHVAMREFEIPPSSRSTRISHGVTH